MHRADEALHAPYRAWVEALVNGPQPFALSVLCAVAFVRITTNPKIYPTPTSLPLALACVEALVEHPNCRLLGPGPRHFSLWTALCRSSGARGKIVADAQHAALAMEHGCTFVTRDRDFALFGAHGLRWQHLELRA